MLYSRSVRIQPPSTKEGFSNVGWPSPIPNPSPQSRPSDGTWQTVRLNARVSVSSTSAFDASRIPTRSPDTLPHLQEVFCGSSSILALTAKKIICSFQLPFLSLSIRIQDSPTKLHITDPYVILQRLLALSDHLLGAVKAALETLIHALALHEQFLVALQVQA